MLAHERHRRILQLVAAHGTVKTVELAGELGVTDETIRRDLLTLADKHLVDRIHGGASSLKARPTLRSFEERRAHQVEQKRVIGAAALDMIEAGNTYAFDSSTTTFELVARLPDRNFRVVTNAFSVLEHLSRYDQVDLISTGGRFHPKTQTFIGGESIRAISRHNVQIAFVSAIGIDLGRGCSEGFEEQALFKSHLVEVAERTVLLVDSTKFNQRSEYFFCGLNAVSTIITDEGADLHFVSELEKQGCEVIVAPTR